MDIQHFIKIFWRKKFTLLSIMMASAVLAYLVVGMQAASYKSNAILSAGITIDKSIKLNQNDPFVQEFEINSKFSNLMENMKSRTSLRLLSYSLLLHDLDAIINSEEDHPPFRVFPEDSEDLENVSMDEVSEFLNTLDLGQLRPDSAGQQQLIISQTFSQEEDAIYQKLAKAFEYDFESLSKKLAISRIGKTDYLKVEFESENPLLCEFAVDNFCNGFITYNIRSTNSEESRSVNFFEKLALEKKRTLDTLTNAIGDYKKRYNIVDLEAQSESVVSQLAELEKLRVEESKQIEGRKRAIGNLNAYIDKSVEDGTDNYSSDASLRNRFKSVNEEIKTLRDKMANSGADAKLQRQLDAKRQEQQSVLNQMASREVVNAKDFEKKADKLEDNRISEEVDLAMAEEAEKVFDTEIDRLRGQASNLVSAEKDIENLQGRKEIALQEYLQAVEQLNAANVRLSSLETSSAISIFEHAQVPEEPEATNRAIISAFAGVAGLSLSTFFLFLVALFDGRIASPEYFERITKSPLLGYLNTIRINQLDLEDLFEHPTNDKKLNSFKEALRRIRYSLVNSGAKTVLFTSTAEQTGKTFTLLSLAYSLSKNKKRVLVIDTNFKSNTLTSFANKELDNNPLHNGYVSNESFIEEFDEDNIGAVNESGELIQENLGSRSVGALGLLTARKRKVTTDFILNGQVDIIGNIQSSHSPSEILADKDFKAVLDSFEAEYDFILLEAAAMNDYSDARELIQYVDKVVTIFDARTPFRQADKDSLAFLNGMEEGKYLGAILNQVDLKNVN